MSKLPEDEKLLPLPSEEAPAIPEEKGLLRMWDESLPFPVIDLEQRDKKTPPNAATLPKSAWIE